MVVLGPTTPRAGLQNPSERFDGWELGPCAETGVTGELLQMSVLAGCRWAELAGAPGLFIRRLKTR